MPDSLAAERPSHTLRLGCSALYIILLTAAIAFGLVTAGTTDFFEEGGAVELTQVALWIAAALTAAVAGMLPNPRADRAAIFLLGVMATLAAARELDAHIYLNPETLGDYGVRYRIDWWLDGAVNPLLKLAWAAAALIVFLALTLPAWAARPTLWRIITRRTRVFWLGAASAACLAAGFTVDDLLRGKLDINLAHAIEESVELLGPALYLAAVLALYAASSKRNRVNHA